MRSDMFKVIVERPRKWKSDGVRAAQLRNDFDGPSMLGTRAGYSYRALNENLSPLRRYLHSQVGRPWSKVFSEICAQIDRRNTVQQHIHQHIGDFIATDVAWHDGKLVDLKSWHNGWTRDLMRQPLYVDPKSGLIRVNDSYRSWSRLRKERRREAEARASAVRLEIDASTFLLKLDDCWFLVGVAPFPQRTLRGAYEPCFDVVLKRKTLRMNSADDRERARLYGRTDLYAVSKRQISRREMARFGVTSR